MGNRTDVQYTTRCEGTQEDSVQQGARPPGGSEPPGGLSGGCLSSGPGWFSAHEQRISQVVPHALGQAPPAVLHILRSAGASVELEVGGVVFHARCSLMFLRVVSHVALLASGLVGSSVPLQVTFDWWKGQARSRCSEGVESQGPASAQRFRLPSLLCEWQRGFPRHPCRHR